jgi:hypothetical protein
MFICLGLDMVMISNFQGSFATQSMASLELYLHAMSKTEIAAAMINSQTLASNPDCISG